jgi:hypothetical protein
MSGLFQLPSESRGVDDADLVTDAIGRMSEHAGAAAATEEQQQALRVQQQAFYSYGDGARARGIGSLFKFGFAGISAGLLVCGVWGIPAIAVVALGSLAVSEGMKLLEAPHR